MGFHVVIKQHNVTPNCQTQLFISRVVVNEKNSVRIRTCLDNNLFIFDMIKYLKNNNKSNCFNKSCKVFIKKKNIPTYCSYLDKKNFSVSLIKTYFNCLITKLTTPYYAYFNLYFLIENV